MEKESYIASIASAWELREGKRRGREKMGGGGGGGVTIVLCSDCL